MNANLMTKKIEMTKTESKNAGKIGTAEYNTLMQLMQSFPTFTIEIKAPAKRKSEFKGLDYKFMKNYILKCNKDNKAEILAEFNTLTAQAKKNGEENSEYMEAASYLDVKKWFLATFPEIAQFRDDHKQKIKDIMSKVPA